MSKRLTLWKQIIKKMSHKNKERRKNICRIFIGLKTAPQKAARTAQTEDADALWTNQCRAVLIVKSLTRRQDSRQCRNFARHPAMQ